MLKKERNESKHNEKRGLKDWEKEVTRKAINTVTQNQVLMVYK